MSDGNSDDEVVSFSQELEALEEIEGAKDRAPKE